MATHDDDIMGDIEIQILPPPPPPPLPPPPPQSSPTTTKHPTTQTPSTSVDDKNDNKTVDIEAETTTATAKTATTASSPIPLSVIKRVILATFYCILGDEFGGFAIIFVIMVSCFFNMIEFLLQYKGGFSRKSSGQVNHTTSETTSSTATAKTATAASPLTPLSVIKDAILAGIYCLAGVVFFEFGIIFVIVGTCVFNMNKFPLYKRFSRKSRGQRPSKGVYKKMQDFKSTRQKIMLLNLVATTQIGCLFLVWLLVNVFVPSLNSKVFFNYPLWTWSLLGVVIFLGYPLSALFTDILLRIIQGTTTKLDLQYFLRGLENSLRSLFHFGCLLFVWLYYFRAVHPDSDQDSSHHQHHPFKRVIKVVTWTFVSLLVGAALCVAKRLTLLEWKANAVYRRFKVKILTAGFHLYFLSIVIDGDSLPWLMPWRGADQKQDRTSSTTEGAASAKDTQYTRVQDYMLSQVLALQQIQAIALYVSHLRLVTQRENDGIPEIVARCQDKFPTHHESTSTQYITKEALETIFGLAKEDAELLLQELKGEKMSDQILITYDDFQKWIVDAHKNCLSVGYTLIDAFGVVNVLNRVIIGFIVVTVILVWLLLTGLATTKVLVLIASPFLTFTFVFGDTCKTFFQGVIFSFVTHPYDVGDRCIIDGIELEVKRIGILTTIFVKIGTKEKVIYPNTSLATKVITNLEGEPDPSDMIELILDSSTPISKILSLKKDLESFFQSMEPYGSYEKNIYVVVEEIRSSIKVSISFTHVMNVQDVSHSQCLQKKNNQRSELLIIIKQFLEDQEIKLATAILEIMSSNPK